jgi:hypothetical protein
MTRRAQATTAAWIARQVPKTGTRSSGRSGGAVSGMEEAGQRPGRPLCDNLAVITGFNTDVKFRGLVYHVQTEDKGSVNPLIETLIYKGGEILASRRLPYAELVRDSNTEAAISRLMEDQHKAMILEVKRGRFAPPQELAEEDLSLDEIVLAYLAARPARPA